MSDKGSGAASVLVKTLREVPAFTKGVGLTLGFVALGSGVELIPPILVQRVIDNVDTFSKGVLYQWGGLALAGVILSALASRAGRTRLAVAAAHGLHDIRVMTFGRLHQRSILHTQEQRRGALVARVTADIDAIQRFFDWGGVGLLVGLARVLFTMTLMFLLSWKLAALVGATTALYVFLLIKFQKVLGRAHDRARGSVANAMAIAGEAVSGVPTIRAHGAEKHILGRLSKALEREFWSDFKARVMGNALFATAELYSGSITAGVVVVGVLLGIQDAFTAGELVAFMLLVALLVDPLQTMVETIDSMQSAAAGLRRIFKVLDADIEVSDPGESGTALPAGGFGVAATGVSFAYGDGPDVLSDVNVAVGAGQRIAVVGETGSGKTTFSKLVVRLMEPKVGQISLAGIPINRIPFNSLRSRVTFVPQEGFLMDGTVLTNVQFGKPAATRDEVRKAFDDLGLGAWLDGLSDGLDSEVGERGAKLSAGERQLVALTRAWIVNPDLLVLDEATSAVDPALELQLRDALNRLLEGRTSLTVAHRLSTAQAADAVLVFDQGQLVERGTHVELVAAGGIYTKMFEDWMAGTTSSA